VFAEDFFEVSISAILVTKLIFEKSKKLKIISLRRQIFEIFHKANVHLNSELKHICVQKIFPITLSGTFRGDDKISYEK
jgi:hypothetical protein